MLNENKMKVKKGSLAVHVGLEDDEIHKFVIPISYLYHSSFKGLLEKTHEMYGYHTVGPLRLPCSVDDFLHLKWIIEREGSGSAGRHHQSHHNHPQFHHSLSFNSC